MKVYTCTIARRENDYLCEFVEHYKSIGITKMFIYDNGFDDDENPKDVLGKYIEEGFVELIDFRNKKNAHCDSYNDFIIKHVKEYDWALFIDVDEFLFFKRGSGIKNVSQFLAMDIFNDFDQIVVNWEIYGDNEKIEKEDLPVVQRFTKKNSKSTYNNHGKCFLRGRMDYYFEGNVWHLNPMLKGCNECGQEVTVDFNEHKNKYAEIRHYMSKSLEEFLAKAERGYPDNPHFNNDYETQRKEFIQEMFIRKYFSINKMTKEKNDYLEKKLGWKFDTNKLKKIYGKNR